MEQQSQIVEKLARKGGHPPPIQKSPKHLVASRLFTLCLLLFFILKYFLIEHKVKF